MALGTFEVAPTKQKQVKRIKILRHAEAKELERQINSFLESADYSFPITFPVTVTIVPELIQECYVALIEYWETKSEPKPELETRKVRFRNAKIVFDDKSVAPIHFSDGELQYLEEQGVINAFIEESGGEAAETGYSKGTRRKGQALCRRRECDLR
jgi:hypothetical protein